MLSDRLKNLRQEKKWTQQYTAELLKIPRGTYAHYEIGKRQPDYNTLNDIANLFMVSVDYLTGNTDNPNPINNKIKTSCIDLELYNIEKKLKSINKLTYNGKLIDENSRLLILNALQHTKEIANIAINLKKT